jgi:hypothetical protein
MSDDFAQQCVRQSITERISVQLTIDLGVATTPLSSLLNIAAGTRLAVNIPESETLALRLSGRPLAYGKIVNTESGIFFEVIRTHSKPLDRKELVEALPDEHYQGS